MDTRRIGKAYGFLQTNSSAQRIRQAFGNMKTESDRLDRSNAPESERLKIPQELDIVVHAPFHETMLLQIFGADATEISKLLRTSAGMKGESANCMVEAVLPEVTDREAAAELGYILNLMYSCTEIMGDAEIPIADIYFRNDKGIYVSKLEVEGPH